MLSFRFIHTGDIHLDSPLKGLAGQQGAAADRIRTATRTAFENLISRAIEDEVDFVVIAGGLYDGDWRDYQTGLFFVKQMGRLSQAKIPVFLLHGNHDAESQITRKLTLPANVSVFSARKPETFRLPHLNVALHGQSFRQRDITGNLVPAYPPPVASCFNIGVLHTSLGGMPGHANYAPCSIEDLINKGYDYWALAHVHQAAVLHEQPHVIFCGNLQGRHIRETGAKGASLVTVEDSQVVEIAPLHVDCVRWSFLQVPVEQCGGIADAVDRIRQAIEEAVERDAQGRLLACRIEVTGATGLHGELLASADHLLAEARAAALGLGDEVAWIERLIVATVSPEASASRKDALGDLQRIIESAGSDTELQARIATELGDLIRKLPHDIRANADDAVLKAAIDGNIANLIAHGGAYLSARLATEKV
ncbi:MULTISPECIES: metallophosphoesterase family protein [Bradyrhizobium]|uniref:metallophosphoesterase family protein n=1 Tax=Bradyrhizobium TaxID=374 RepID=UPI00155E2508|nr:MULTISPECIES: DNA repair exonuclease [Bradyrhizobium]MDD1520684.1 DNA repair exonuclease [Bradyrhizobium sp. WBAH30]MDD1545736.1 DNA repair exonuclease [Bradyrhizobium sp. WBAH41]MDD1559003.1 DNA repair exonuclease [Bradyrhizobium sp. WBAH23]MDD1566346.1 DNA repair exonuclease [Bradyrhizobium sp. WBAH33]MDD1591940.1 DNA repair exonuclease [Bradyrhizobium sp. WBAH42]